jgi:DNA-binding NarL/FixJ family response regulator
MKSQIKIAIAEPSAIIRNGVLALLKQIPALNIHVVEITDIAQLSVQLFREKVDLLIINPDFLGVFSLQQIKKDAAKQLKCIALQYTMTSDLLTRNYDEIISVNDSAELISQKIQQLVNLDVEQETQEPLTQREKEIVVCVVKGMTNKQIAEELFLSTHTVITHRRNIAAKLGIHSSAGLTIYAIVNKLVEINDIKIKQ